MMDPCAAWREYCTPDSSRRVQATLRLPRLARTGHRARESFRWGRASQLCAPRGQRVSRRSGRQRQIWRGGCRLLIGPLAQTRALDRLFQFFLAAATTSRLTLPDCPVSVLARSCPISVDICANPPPFCAGLLRSVARSGGSRFLCPATQWSDQRVLPAEEQRTRTMREHHWCTGQLTKSVVRAIVLWPWHQRR